MVHQNKGIILEINFEFSLYVSLIFKGNHFFILIQENIKLKLNKLNLWLIAPKGSIPVNYTVQPTSEW